MITRILLFQPIFVPLNLKPKELLEVIEVQKILYKAGSQGHLVINESAFISALRYSIDVPNPHSLIERALKLGIINRTVRRF